MNIYSLLKQFAQELKHQLKHQLTYDYFIYYELLNNVQNSYTNVHSKFRFNAYNKYDKYKFIAHDNEIKLEEIKQVKMSAYLIIFEHI